MHQLAFHFGPEPVYSDGCAGPWGVWTLDDFVAAGWLVVDTEAELDAALAAMRSKQKGPAK